MDWETIRSKWPHYMRSAQAQWSQISEREFELIDGQRDVLAGHISAVYGISRNAAQMQLAAWQGRQRAIEPGA